MAFESIALTGQKEILLLITGLAALIIAVLVHAINILRTIIGRKSKNSA